jgi:acyl-coenzyme A thioesterase PaaI-like protein
MNNSNFASEVTKKGFINHIGGIDFKKVSENTFEFNVTVKNYNLNSGGISHGGYIAAILDNGMGSAAYHVIDGKRCVTIALDIKFISASKVKISKKTNSLVFVVAELFEKTNLVATASGTWKII